MWRLGECDRALSDPTLAFEAGSQIGPTAVNPTMLMVERAEVCCGCVAFCSARGEFLGPEEW